MIHATIINNTISIRTQDGKQLTLLKPTTTTLSEAMQRTWNILNFINWARANGWKHSEQEDAHSVATHVQAA